MNIFKPSSYIIFFIINILFYIFYDFETTGKGKKASSTSFGQSPNWEQILQVGAIVADENLQSTPFFCS